MTDPITPLSDSDEQAIRETYLIWSFEHEAWWAPNRCGYRAPHLLDEAGRYSEAEATEICRFANQERPAHSPHEVGVRLTTAVPEIGKLLSELTRLRDECKRLAQDKERLDWLEKNPGGVSWGTGYLGASGAWISVRRGEGSVPRNSLREAIDAASRLLTEEERPR